MAILEELYFSTMDTHYGSSRNARRMNKLFQALEEKEEQLTEKLNGEAKTLLLKLLDLQSEAIGAVGMEQFIAGVRIGAKLMAEIME